jgi:hypothetical protein
MTVYAGLKTTPSQVVKISTPGMGEAGRWVGEAGDVEVSALGNYGDYNHVAPNIAPSKIIPLRDLKVVQRHTLSEGEVRASTYGRPYVDNCLYLAPDTGTDPCIVKKVDPVTLDEEARWTGGVGDGNVLCLVMFYFWGVSWLYAGLDSGAVVKINVSDMSEAGRWTGVGAVNALSSHSNPWLFAGLSTGDVVRINPSTMVESSRYSGASAVLSLARSGSGVYVFAGLNSGQVLQIIVNTMALQLTWAGGAAINALCNASGLCAGLNSTPAAVVKLNENTMEEMYRWTGGAGDSIVRCILVPGAIPPIYVGLESKTVVSLYTIGEMTEVGRWTGGADDAAILSLTQNGNASMSDHVWAGLNLSPGVVVPISPTSMNEAKIWENVDAERILSLVSPLPGSSEYFPGYAGLDRSPGVAIQFGDDHGYLWEKARWTGGAGDGPVTSLAVYISAYLGLQTGQVVKTDPATMTEVARWVGTDPVVALVATLDYVFAGLGTIPGQVVEIEADTMTEVGRWIGASEEEIVTSLAMKGEYLYIGGASGEGGPGPGPNGVGRGYGVLIA